MSAANGTGAKVLVYRVTEQAHPIRYRIVVEGIRYGEPRTVKQDAMEEMQTLISQITGAEVVYVTTARSGQRSGRGTPRINLGARPQTKRTKQVDPLNTTKADPAAELAFKKKAVRKMRRTMRAYWAKMTPEERQAEVRRRMEVTRRKANAAEAEQTP